MINVFNIERFATHDGEGIRTVVFLKGCPLHCPWCANPESWDIEPQLLYNKKKCCLCKNCEAVCTSGAIYFEYDEFHYNKKKNDLCKASVEACPTGALEIVGQTMSNEEILEIVMKDIDYYKNSGGGVTVSGGEPFYQFEAMLSLLQEFKKAKLTIAVETTGHCGLEQIQQAEPYIDTFLYDIKHLDAKLLQKITGIEKDRVMRNFEYLTKVCPDKVIIRVPVIPGFNNTETFIESIIELAKTRNVREVNLLPYHTLGKSKWDRVMKPYYSNQKMLNKAELEKYVTRGLEIGVKVKIGG